MGTDATGDSDEAARHGVVLAWRTLPLFLLMVFALTILIAGLGESYGLLLIVVPLLAATTYGPRATALVGLLTLGVAAALRSSDLANGSTLAVMKLAVVAAAGLLSIALSALKVRDVQLRESRNSALALQRGLLPRDFPHNNAVSVAYRYVPADTAAGVGGDWFDVIPLSGARVALVMGDVVGHGVRAAATMGQMRSALHTLADLDLAPDEVLARMDDMVQRMRPGRPGQELTASCLFMVYDPISRQCTVASAGHPPPVFIRPDGKAVVGPNTTNPLLGLGSAPFETFHSDLPEGTVIALYTDGLLGLRHQETDQAIATLTEAIARVTDPLQSLCNRVLGAMPSGHEDDTALLLARTQALDHRNIAAWEFPAAIEQVPIARSAAMAQLTMWGLEEQAFAFELVVCELVTNAVEHAEGPVSLRLIRDMALICEVSDTSSTAPHIRRADALDEGGRGLFLVDRLSDRWGTRYRADGKTIWAEMDLTSPPARLLAPEATS